jgi:hypothetical protein
MKLITTLRLLAALLPALLCSCATWNDQPESMRATQAMTDMDGSPIYSGPYSGLSIGFGFGNRHHGGGTSIGFGVGW